MKFSRILFTGLLSVLLSMNAGCPVHAATFTWNGGVDDWFNSSAWTPQGIPGPSDTAVINGGAATADSAVNVAEIDIATPAGSPLATLDGTATITVSQALKFADGGGILHGAGKIEIEPNAALQINSAAQVNIDQRTIDIMGSGVWTGNGAISMGSGATINNTGSFDIQVNANGIFGDGSAVTFNNTGSLTRTAGADYAEFDDVTFNNQGTVNVKSGQIQFLGDGIDSGAFQADGGSFEFGKGSVMLTAASTISGTGAVVFDGASVVDAGSYTVTGSTMILGGSVTFTKPFVSATPLDVASTLTFDSGFMQNSGSTTLDGGTLISMNGINIGGGAVTGSGTLSGAVSNSGAITPGTPEQLGNVIVSGNLTEMANGVINIRIGAPGAARGRQSAAASDVVSVSGAAHLGGTLNVTIPAGTSAISNLKVMSYDSQDGFFANVLGVAAPNRVVVGPKDVTVTSDAPGSLALGIRMVSVPYDFSSSGETAADLFQVAPLSDGTMPIATWDPTKPGYLYYPQLPGTQAQPGRGYWILLRAPKTLGAVGKTVSSPFVQALSPGWNMIGDPFPTAVDVSTLQFSVGVAVGSNPANSLLSFTTASAAGLVGSTLFGYSGSGYVAANTLQPYNGYWIYVDPTISQNKSVQVTFTRS